MDEARWDIATPGLLLDLARFDANARRLADRTKRLAPDLALRPHMKTLKSVELGRRLTHALGADAITVSTLAEAEAFAKAGYHDILYAVGITRAKLPRVAAMVAGGVDCQIVTDNAHAAGEIARFCADHAVQLPVLIEIDCDGQRAGVKPEDREGLLAIADTLGQTAELRGVMTHGGGSYGAVHPGEREAAALQEADAVRSAARILREAGFQAPTVSLGSTPTAFAGADWSGITELRAGVFPFFDLVMAGLGVCERHDIALSVLTTVIGHQREKGWILCDAGWMALSRDRGTQGQAVDCFYGLVCDAKGTVLPDLIVQSTNQEHGIITVRDSSSHQLPDIEVGAQLRILPNHACATAAQHQGYNVITSNDPLSASVEWMPRFSGW